MNRYALTRMLSVVLALAFAACASGAIGLEFGKPDGKPGDQTKAVRVYILAGQSNMVGMGDLTGARPLYPSIYYTPDPAVIPGRMPVGSSAVESLEVTGATVPLGQVNARVGENAVVTAMLTAPATGQFQIHTGFGDSSYNVTTLDGQEVYRRDVGGKPVIQIVKLEQDKSYPVTIKYFRGGSAAFWMEQIGLEGRGDLETLTKKDGKYTWLIDGEGNWTARQDVLFTDARIGDGSKSTPLSATSNNGKSIGPELGFGYVVGEFHDAPVLLIKTSMGNRSLGFDFRPPSSGRPNPDTEWEGKEYRLMVEGVRKALANIKDLVPGYQGQGYEIVGFGWFQGHKDQGSTKEEYEKHLINMINDVRKEFDAPKMKAVVATIGFGGWRLGGKYQGTFDAQMAVGDPKQHPEFAGNVASVDIRDYWRELIESPKSQDYHYHRNAETYWLIGDAMGRAMVRLEGGQAEPRPLSKRKARAEATKAAAEEGDENQPTEEERAASLAALKPLILDGALVKFVSDDRNAKAIDAALSGDRPSRTNQFPRDVLDAVAQYYQAAGIDDYQWRDFGPDMKSGGWEYFSFAPDDGKQGDGYRKVNLPAGMDNWFAPDFDAAKAGWKTGAAPFGQKDGKLEAIGGCEDNDCRCGIPPKTRWEKEVLLMRKTVELPPLKRGYRYRILLGGASHVNGGEGFALYVDGKKVAESSSGVGKRQGGQPRGTLVYNDFKPALEDGKVTIAVTSFLRYKHPRIENFPPSGHLSVWIEQQKLPPIE